MHLITHAENSVSTLELRRHVGVSWPTAWLIKPKLSQAMFERGQDHQLNGRVEVDEAYLGGERHGGKPGYRSPNKFSFVAAVQTSESGQPVLMCLAPYPFTKHAIAALAAQPFAARVSLVTDLLECFPALQRAGILHEPHVADGGPAGVAHSKYAKCAHRYLVQPLACQCPITVLGLNASTASVTSAIDAMPANRSPVNSRCRGQTPAVVVALDCHRVMLASAAAAGREGPSEFIDCAVDFLACKTYGLARCDIPRSQCQRRVPRGLVPGSGSADFSVVLNRTLKTAPGAAFSAEMVQPWARAIARQIDNPRPAPSSRR